MKEQTNLSKNLPKITVKVVFIFIWIFMSVHYWQVLGQYFQNPNWHINYIPHVTILESWFLLCLLVTTAIVMSLTKDLGDVEK